MADVFGRKHLEAMADVVKSKYQLVSSHIPMPAYKPKEFLDRLIKEEHRNPLRQVEAIVGSIQSHTYVKLKIRSVDGSPPRPMVLHFKSVDKILPKYVHDNFMPEEDPYFAPALEWYKKRMECKNEFSDVLKVLRYMNKHGESIAGVKLYFHGITALMEKVEGLEKRTEASREVKVPRRMPYVEIHMRELGKRATKTLAVASLYNEAVALPTTYLETVDDMLY